MNTVGAKTDSTTAQLFRRNKLDSWWWLVVAVGVLLAVLVFLKPDPFQRIIVFVADGVWVTFYITLVTFLLVLVLGLFGGLGRLSRNPLIRGIAGVYVEVIRGIPVLVQIFVWYFAFPAMVQQLGRAWNIQSFATFRPSGTVMVIVALTVCYAAYMSEVYRAGIQSIQKGQMEAARSLGMNYVQAMRYVILPQAVRVILPPVGNEFVTLLKDTSLASVVSLPDLTRQGREFMASTFILFETWIMVALLYLVMTLLAARIISWLEKRSKMEH